MLNLSVDTDAQGRPLPSIASQALNAENALPWPSDSRQGAGLSRTYDGLMTSSGGEG
jgi:hypothetical protein